MFSHGMKEAKEGRVVIEDAKESTVRAMLRFMYSGECPELKQSDGKEAKSNLKQTWEDVLRLADRCGLLDVHVSTRFHRYQVSDLVALCTHKLARNLSVDTAA